jgi:uncharacterized protein (DUF488 family)
MIYTIGHSNRELAEFIQLLEAWKIQSLADVRSIPFSRTNPQFNQDTLPQALIPFDIAYHHIPKLGGRRGRSKEVENSSNTGWEHQNFRNYADYALTNAFQEGLEELLALTSTHTTAYMCSEAVWWRCHRRIITDYLLARDIEIKHIMSLTKANPATLTPFAKIKSPTTIIYPGTEWLDL